MNNIEALEKYALSLECSAERGVSMKNYTSFKVGGPAELFLSPEDAAASDMSTGSGTRRSAILLFRDILITINIRSTRIF